MFHTEKYDATEEKKEKIIFFTIQYYGQESIIFTSRVKKICQELLSNLVIQFCFRKNMSLKSVFLPKPKGNDGRRKNKNLVYSIPCLDCDTVYVDETSRLKVTRMNEHKAKIKSLSSDSNLVEHILENNHRFDFSNTHLETD